MRLPPPNKVLIIRLSSIGDILLTSPVIRQTRERYPTAQIDFLTRTEFISLVATNPHLNTVLPLDTSKGKTALKSMRDKIQNEQYDLILDLHANLRSIFLCRFTNHPPVYRIQKNKFARFMLVKAGIDLYSKLYGKPRSVAEKYLRVGEVIGLDPKDQRLELWLPPDSETAAENRWKALQEKGAAVIMAPGARHFTKRWPVSHYIELIKKLHSDYGWRTVLLGGPDEQDISKSIHTCAGKERVDNLTGSLSLIESCALIKQAQLFISNDSGLMHVAAAYGIPQLAFFGSTTQQLGFSPLNKSAVVLENKELSCRPCSHIGKSACPKGHFKCMNDLKPEMASASIKELIGE